MSSGTPVQRRKLGVCMAKRKQKMKRLDHGGYSLVELMVVIVIMVILASVSIGVYNGYVNRARSAVFYEKGHRNMVFPENSISVRCQKKSEI